jgi:hypothetical protein
MTKTQKYYVSMTDKFMSYWGMSEGKINKLVIECDNYDDAITVHNNALRRSEMKYVNINLNKPKYNKNKYYVSLHNKLDYTNWFKEGAFKGDLEK